MNLKSVEQRISCIEECERRFRTLEWNFTSTQYTLSSANDLSSIVEKHSTFREGTLLVETGSLRFRGQATMISRWHHGAAPYIGQKIWVSYDGSQYRIGKRSRHGAEIPRESDFSYGEIDSRPENYRQRWAFDAGIIYLAPFFHTHDQGVRTFAETLRCKQDRGLESPAVDDDPDVWSFTCTDGTETLRLEYSWQTCAVRSAIWGGGDPFRVFQNRAAEGFVQLRDGFWAPTAVRSMHIPCGSAPVMTHMEFFNVKVNQSVDDADYRIEFPIGMQVDDHTSKRTYVTGHATDEPTAIRKYLERNQLKNA